MQPARIAAVTAVVAILITVSGCSDDHSALDQSTLWEVHLSIAWLPQPDRLRVEADVTRNGLTAPDGTLVTFELSGDPVPDGQLCVEERTSTGRAAIMVELVEAAPP